MKELLTFEEITTVCKQAVSLGIKHIIITGGEPLVRRGLLSLIGMIKDIPGIETISMTTNGVLLESFLPELKKNGLKNVNISLDTLDRALYHLQKQIP